MKNPTDFLGSRLQAHLKIHKCEIIAKAILKNDQAFHQLHMSSVIKICHKAIINKIEIDKQTVK